ncbi:MAG TPA: class I SAM-dependent methyltransferase [Vicinamibacterales bacterium]
MSNDEAYAGGLLNRALDPAIQPSEIRAFLEAEIGLLRDLTTDGMRVIDIGCGTGRHLAMLRDRLGFAVGVDYQHAYLVEAHVRAGARPLSFVTGDATAVPIASTFDLAICMTNTWGTMSDKTAVLREMRRLAPGPRRRLLSVYSAASVQARCEWYRRLGHEAVEVTDEFILTEGDFRSEHFSEARLRELVGDCVVRSLTEIAYVVTF